MSIRMLGLCLLATAFSLCLHADCSASAPYLGDPVASAPWLADERYTVHASGPLQDVVNTLQEIVGRYISLGTQEELQSPDIQALRTKPVSLSFDNATLADILRSLCSQAGLVVEIMADTGPRPDIYLEPGDPAKDCRPTARAGDYTLRVLEVELGRGIRFHAGQPSAVKLPSRGSVELHLQVWPRSTDAAHRLAGLGIEATAVPDDGPLIASTPQPNRLPFNPTTGLLLAGQPIAHGYVVLTAPSPSATRLTRLTGKLFLFSQVQVDNIKLRPADLHRTIAQQDCSVRLDAWDLRDNRFTVKLQVTTPLLPGVSDDPGFAHCGLEAVLVREDGRRIYLTTRSVSTGQDPRPFVTDRVYDFPPWPTRGPNAPALKAEDIDYLLVSIVRTGPVDKTIPFVIENIPLP